MFFWGARGPQYNLLSPQKYRIDPTVKGDHRETPKYFFLNVKEKI